MASMIECFDQKLFYERWFRCITYDWSDVS